MRTPEEWAEFLDTVKEWAEELRSETADYELEVIAQGEGDRLRDDMVRALSAVKLAALSVEHAASPLIRRDGA